MKIKQVENRINASYNTIKKFIESDQTYFEIRDNVIHVTEKGILELEKKYGLNTEIITDDKIIFYKNQLVFLENQLKETQKYNNVFLNQIEQKSIESKELSEELLKNRELIASLESELQKKEIIEIELKHELDEERNKSVFRKIFGRKSR